MPKPTRVPGETSNRKITIEITESENKKIREAALRNHQGAPTFVRDLVLDAIADD